eukprot:scaffold1142_cov387-Prasinococcus_capsulatus_cf.AAC.21
MPVPMGLVRGCMPLMRVKVTMVQGVVHELVGQSTPRSGTCGFERRYERAHFVLRIHLGHCHIRQRGRQPYCPFSLNIMSDAGHRQASPTHEVL